MPLGESRDGCMDSMFTALAKENTFKVDKEAKIASVVLHNYALENY